MSLPRRAARRDLSEGPIVEALRAFGYSVERLSKRDVPDLLVGKHGISRVVECKTDDGELSTGQRDWWGAWRGNGAIVLRTVEDVERLDRVWLVLGAGLFPAK